MKTFKSILIITIVVLMLNSCARDEDLIRYYKQPTGEGYVFVKNEDGTITPYANKKDCIRLESSWNDGSELFSPSGRHKDLFSTDANGKFTCKFVKTINKHIVEYYAIGLPECYSGTDENGNEIYGEISSHNGGDDWFFGYCPNNEFAKENLIVIDTIFITLRK